MSQYQPLPTPPAADPGQDRHSYGHTLALWLLCQDRPCPVTMDDQQLDITHHYVSQALTRTIILGTGPDAQATPATVYDRLEELRRLLRQTMDRRQALAEAEAMAGPETDPEPVPPPPSPYDDRSQDGGDKEPRNPHPPTMPPQGQAVDFLTSLRDEVRRRDVERITADDIAF